MRVVILERKRVVVGKRPFLYPCKAGNCSLFFLVAIWPPKFRVLLIKRKVKIDSRKQLAAFLICFYPHVTVRKQAERGKITQLVSGRAEIQMQIS